MKVAFVRGGYLNNFEAQNYKNLGKKIHLTAISSLHSIHNKFPFMVIKLPSLYDIGFPSWIANRTFGDRQILFGLDKAVEKADIVHTADPHYYYSYQLAKMRKVGKIKKLISTSWETIPFNNESTYAKKRIKRFAMKHIDQFLCYSERARKCLVEEGVSPAKITEINLGVDIKRFIPNKRLMTKQKIRILYTGRDVPEKGLTDLRLALKKQLETKEVQLLVAGSIPYEKMPEVYRLADIFVMPSKTTKTWEEQYGMSLIEAMASGLPIVAYRSGSIPEILGNTGILVSEGEVKTLRSQLEKLIKNHTLRLKLGTMARSRALQYFDADKTARKLQKFYETISTDSFKRRTFNR